MRGEERRALRRQCVEAGERWLVSSLDHLSMNSRTSLSDIRGVEVRERWLVSSFDHLSMKSRTILLGFRGVEVGGRWLVSSLDHLSIKRRTIQLFRQAACDRSWC